MGTKWAPGPLFSGNENLRRGRHGSDCSDVVVVIVVVVGAVVVFVLWFLFSMEQVALGDASIWKSVLKIIREFVKNSSRIFGEIADDLLRTWSCVISNCRYQMLGLHY